jgi:hypothetical protein
MVKRFNDFHLNEFAPWDEFSPWDEFDKPEMKLLSYNVDNGIAVVKFPKQEQEIKKNDEKEVKETIYFNDRLLDVLNKIPLFVDRRWRLPKYDITFINFTDKDDTISYTPASKMRSVGFENWYDNKYTQEMRVGKFFKKIFPMSSDKEIEETVNKYKALYEIVIKNRFKNIKLVKGSEIREWYKIENVAGKYRVNSCMVIPDTKWNKLISHITFRIYKNNPSKVNLMILTDDDNKLMGRALVWFLDEPEGKVYMDRIYGDEKVMALFREYAKKEGWLSYNFPGEEKLPQMKVHIKKDYGAPKYNPYMDTFSNFNKKGKFLCNQMYGGRLEDWRLYGHFPMHH